MLGCSRPCGFCERYFCFRCGVIAFCLVNHRGLQASQISDRRALHGQVISNDRYLQHNSGCLLRFACLKTCLLLSFVTSFPTWWEGGFHYKTTRYHDRDLYYCRRQRPQKLPSPVVTNIASMSHSRRFATMISPDLYCVKNSQTQRMIDRETSIKVTGAREESGSGYHPNRQINWRLQTTGFHAYVVLQSGYEALLTAKDSKSARDERHKLA